MKRIASLLFASLFSLGAFAEQRMTFHSASNGDVVYSVFNCKDIRLSGGKALVEAKDGSVMGDALNFQALDSLTFADPISSDKVQILYAGDTVEIINPYAGKGVEVKANGANVSIVSTTDKYITYYLKGTSMDGSLDVTPSAKFALYMDGLVLANMDGSAIRIMEDYRANIILADCSKNALVASCDTINNAALWAKTQVVFCGEVDENGDEIVGGDNGTGHLGISTMAGHGIYSKDYVRVKTGEIVLTDVAGDGINTKDYFRLDGGSVSIEAKGDGIDCNDQIYINGGTLKVTSASNGVKALKCDSVIEIKGGDIDIAMSGNGARAIKNEFEDIIISDAKLKIVMTGSLLQESDGPTYVTGIKTEQFVRLMDGADVDITCGSKATACKGINATSGIQISGAKVIVEVDGLKDYEAESGGKVAGLKTDGNITISNSSVVIVAENLEESGVKAINCSNKDELTGVYEERVSR